MPMQPNEFAKLRSTINQIQTGDFDANHVDNLLIKLRPYAAGNSIFHEVAHFVAHSDERDRGLACDSIIAIVDRMQFFREYQIGNRPLSLREPFPAYIRRLFISQVRLMDENRLRTEHKMSRASLIKKIDSAFSNDRKAGTWSLRPGKGRVELTNALQFVMGFIDPKPAFSVRDFHKELKDVMRTQNVSFDEAAWDAQVGCISLALLCLISNTDFRIANGDVASCSLGTENELRILSGQRKRPWGVTDSEPSSFGKLQIRGDASVKAPNQSPLQIVFPLITTDLDPKIHCDPRLFSHGQGEEEFSDCVVEGINFSRDMSLSDDFKLVRTDSLAQTSKSSQQASGSNYSAR